MSEPSIASLVGSIYAVEPSAFIAERNRIAKALKQSGRAEDAAMISGLRRPKLAEHALNCVAHANPALIDTYADSARRATDAQTEAIGGNAAGLRDATAALRTASVAVVNAAVGALTEQGASGEGQRDEITELLRDLAASGPSGTAQLRAGVIGSVSRDEPDLLASLLGGDIDPASPRSNAAPTRVPKPAKPEMTARAARPSAGDAAEQREHARLEREQAKADKAERSRLDKQVRQATVEVERAELTVADAEQAVARHQKRLDAARAALDEARQTLSEAEDAIDRLGG